VEGLVHVSQLADRRVARAQEVVKVGDELLVKVLKVNPKERRISLSARQASEELDRREVKKFLRSASESSTVTIGDLVGDVFRGADLGDKGNGRPGGR
ncbi:MAG: S1 RNA-binding domain-containing protein, partial [Firmicutes bacterium]|nr:S1 RNA-binding domain-containing protein [Bacillota bacterium]